MEKKLYLEPEMEVIRLMATQTILAGSGIEDDGKTEKGDGDDDDF